MTTKHTCNNGNGPVFGRKTSGCPRCDELLSGAPAVQWRGAELRQFRAEQAARELRYIRTHDCAKAKCGPVCTFGDW